MTTEVRLRPVTDSDEAFLRAVYASTRTDELAPLDWPPEAVVAFCDQQAEAQHTHYRAHYPHASFDVVLVDGRPAGRLYVDRSPEELRIIDIALLPDHRRQGVGSVVLARVLAESDRTEVPVRIHVEQHNPALRWYVRHGFRPIADLGVFWFLERLPSGAAVSERLPSGAEEGVRV